MRIPSSVTELAWEVFSGCTSLRTVELHDGVTVIGRVRSTLIHNLNRTSLKYLLFARSLLCARFARTQAAFHNCSSLIEMRIPPSVTELAAEMFRGCTALRVVELHDGVTIIGEVRSTLIHNLNRANLNY
jgi:hypothetical protein